MRYLTIVTALAGAVFVFNGCGPGALLATKLDKIEYQVGFGSRRTLLPPEGRQLISIKFAPQIEAEKKFLAKDVILEDSKGTKFELLGAAPSDQLEQFRDFSKPIESDRSVLSTRDGSSVTSSVVGLLDGNEPAFKLKGKEAFVTLVFAVPESASGLKLKVADSAPQPVALK